MDRFERFLQSAVALLSGALEPVVAALARLHFFIRSQLGFFSIPPALHGTVIIVLWVVVLVMLVRLLAGWMRLLLLVGTVLVVAKVWGYLPG